AANIKIALKIKSASSAPPRPLDRGVHRSFESFLDCMKRLLINDERWLSCGRGGDTLRLCETTSQSGTVKRRRMRGSPERHAAARRLIRREPKAARRRRTPRVYKS